VCYTVDGFLEKNKDTLLDNISDALARSSNTLLRTLFTAATYAKV
jgi:myosin heavy subunit